MAHKDKRIDVRVYLEPDEHEYLKAVATENGISMSELLRTCTLKKCKFSKKKKASQKLTLPSKGENTEETCSPPPELTKEQIQQQIEELETMFIKLKSNELPNIPKSEYFRKKSELFALREQLATM